MNCTEWPLGSRITQSVGLSIPSSFSGEFSMGAIIWSGGIVAVNMLSHYEVWRGYVVLHLPAKKDGPLFVPPAEADCVLSQLSTLFPIVA